VTAHLAGAPIEELAWLLASGAGVFTAATRVSLWRLRRRRR
jgi:hypothetical protein